MNPPKIYQIDRVQKRVGEALGAEARLWQKGDKCKVFFKFGGNVGQVTYDVVGSKWYGSPRLVEMLKAAYAEYL